MQTFDAVSFLLVSHLTIPDRTELSHPLTRFWMRGYGICLFPYVLTCWLLRDHHIRYTRVGRVVGACFALFHGSAVAMYSWSAWMENEYTLRMLKSILAVHAVWTFWAVWGLLAAE